MTRETIVLMEHTLAVRAVHIGVGSLAFATSRARIVGGHLRIEIIRFAWCWSPMVWVPVVFWIVSMILPAQVRSHAVGLRAFAVQQTTNATSIQRVGLIA